MIGTFSIHRAAGRVTSHLTFLLVILSFGSAWSAEIPAAVEYRVQSLAAVEVQGYTAVTANEMAWDDARRDAEGLPFRFALPVDVALTTDNAGTWENLPDGQRLWRLRLSSPGALSLNLGFVRFHLPEAARLLVYPADDLRGARRFDTEFNAGHGQLWTPVFLTDEVVVELLVPASQQAQVDLELGVIGRGYRFFGEADKGNSGPCNVDVVCPDGDLWRDEIDSVGLLGIGASFVCTGAMINNVESDGRPLFLTASHCNVSAAVAPTVVVYWNYQSPDCGLRDGGSLAQTSNGSTLLARFSVSDFILLELDEAPDPAFGVKYAGWNRTLDDPTSATAIHHPRSDVKSISFEDDLLTTTAYLALAPQPGTGNHLRVADWDVGTTESGSSGSPLFDQDHYIVGQLHGGYAACANDLADWYGRLSTSWVGGGTVDSRLSDHLDPGATGATSAPLFDPLQDVFNLTITPASTVMARGVAGRPIVPVDYLYSITNTGTLDLDYTVQSTASWLALDLTGGHLAVGQQVDLTASLTAEVQELSVSTHRASINFVYPAGGNVVKVREFLLTITENGLAMVGPVPNPFTTPPVAIRINLRASAQVHARVTNMRGLNVRDLGKIAGLAGDNDILWDGLDDHGRRVPSGVYVVTVEGLGQVFRVNVTYAH